ncbi:sensor domain-containing protein [Marinobacter fonticola]|uniref:sensor domain-containing protein n=1 Tax=Marinobacter fonticola TaxID=2603215 RepID=UPI0011E60A09|nr:EAL domain-containing protein [Marinobacter fonticola]
MSDLRRLSPEQRLLLLTRAAGDHAFIVLDVDGYVVDWPENAEKLLGWTEEDVQARHYSEIFSAGGLPAPPLPDPLARANASRQGELSSYWQRCGDGTEFYAEDRTYPLFGERNEWLGFGKILRKVPDESARALTVATSGDDRITEQRQFKAALAAAPIGIVVADADGVVLKMNAAHRRLWGIDPSFTVALEDISQFRAWWPANPGYPRRQLHSQDWPIVRALRGQNVQNELLDIETFGTTPVQKTILVSASAIRDEQDNILGAVVTASDVTTQQEVEAMERETSARLKFILEASRIGDWDLDLVNDVAHCSLIHDQCFGYPEGAPYWGRETFLEHVHPDDREWVASDLTKAIENGKDLDIECRVIWPDGSVHWIHAQGRFYTSHGYPTRMTGIIQEVTERKVADQQILHASLHDPLTDLPNRAKLFEYAEHLLAHSERTGRPSAVFFMDLDRFKRINDTHGHALGDALLKEAATRLRQCIRSEDFLVRLGGDEFLILFQDIADVHSVAETARLIIERVSEPYCIHGQELTLSASIGISLYPRDGADIDVLISHADLAMYQAKQGGRGQFSFYSAELAADTRLTRMIEQKLKIALHQEGFTLAYQPIFDLASGDVISIEALLRWNEMDVGPEQFIPIAEATGIIGSLGSWLLGQVSQQYAAWLTKRLPPLPIAINISVVELRDHEFVDRFLNTLTHASLEPGALQIELTETAAMDDIEHTIAQLAKLKSKGVTIALDDFGTGHSSLTYLARLPLTKVKIDKSFITSLGANSVSQTVTGAMVALSHNLGLEVVAEGIETQSTLEHVRSLGCQQGQGFHLARPMSSEAFEAWYREHLLRRERSLS